MEKGTSGLNESAWVTMREIDKKRVEDLARRYGISESDILGYLFHVADKHLKESLISSPDNALSRRGLVAFSPVSANP